MCLVGSSSNHGFLDGGQFCVLLLVGFWLLLKAPVYGGPSEAMNSAFLRIAATMLLEMLLVFFGIDMEAGFGL